MIGERNAMVRVIGVDGDDLSRVGEELDELGLCVSDEDLIQSTHRSPYAKLGDGDEWPTARVATRHLTGEFASFRLR